jgi:hypothetical protein
MGCLVAGHGSVRAAGSTRLWLDGASPARLPACPPACPPARLPARRPRVYGSPGAGVPPSRVPVDRAGGSPARHGGPTGSRVGAVRGSCATGLSRHGEPSRFAGRVARGSGGSGIARRGGRSGLQVGWFTIWAVPRSPGGMSGGVAGRGVAEIARCGGRPARRTERVARSRAERFAVPEPFAKSAKAQSSPAQPNPAQPSPAAQRAVRGLWLDPSRTAVRRNRRRVRPRHGRKPARCGRSVARHFDPVLVGGRG